MISGSPIGKRHESTSFSTFNVTPDNRAAISACEKLAVGESEGVILCGPVGTGKTHLLISAAREFDRLRTYTPEDPSGEMVEVPPLAELLAGDYATDSRAPYLGRHEIAVKVSVQYWMVLDLAKALRADALEDGRMTEECMRCHLLVIDDVGREKESEFLRQELERIIDFRYREILPTALATNHKPIELYERYGEHMMSRLRQSCEIVEVLGKDYRKEGR